MEYTFEPGQEIAAGTYIVKLIRVGANVGPGNENGLAAVDVGPGVGEEAPVMPPAVVPPQNVVEEEEIVVENNSNNEENNSNNEGEDRNMGGGKRKTRMNKKAKGMKKSKGTRKLSGYMKFAQQARPQVLKNNPNLKSDIVAVGRKIGEMWRALSPAEKARY